jgi:putative transposase
MKAYKFRIYPNKGQEQTLNQTIETCRLLYNQSLQEKREDKLLSYYEQTKALTQIRKGRDDLKRIHSQVLQDVLLRLNKTFQNFFRGQSKRPRFKRYGRYNSITYPQYGAFSIKENRLKLSFINGLIKIELHRIPIGSVKTCTIIRDIDRWFACISTTAATTDVNVKHNSMIGIDVGLTNWITLSNGQVIDRPKFLDNSIGKIKTLQRNLSRKKKGSKNRWKAKIHGGK